MQKGANTFIAQQAYKKLAVGPKGLHGFSFFVIYFIAHSPLQLGFGQHYTSKAFFIIVYYSTQ